MENYKLEHAPVSQSHGSAVSPLAQPIRMLSVTSSLDDWLVWADAEEEL